MSVMLILIFTYLRCFHFTVIRLCFCVKDQNSKHLDDNRETDDMSERTSPNKNLKSPQRGSKRLKTAPFKVTLLDSSEFEGEIEVCTVRTALQLHVF